MENNDGMEPDGEKKKLNEDFVEFMRKQSDTKAPRYTARLKTYVDFHRKRGRATVARRKYENCHEKTLAASRKKGDDELKDKALENSENLGGGKERMSKSSLRSVAADTSEGSFRPLNRRASSASSDIDVDPVPIEPFLAAKLYPCSMRDGEKCMQHNRSISQSRSADPSDKCGGRTRRRRKRSCGRRRRRRRSCRRRRRRRRRSCRRRRSRRRRRRSCGKRRRRRRRGCRCG